MGVSLATLRERLESDVPAYKSVPDEDQYERAVRTAALDYSRRRPLEKLTTLSIVSGTAAYDLPNDFLKVIRLEMLVSADGVLHTSAGLVPTSTASPFRQRYYIGGGQITFDPTPQYTMSRDLWYAARYALDSDDVYADMDEEVAGIVLLKAQAIALGLQANKASQEAWQYQIGDERVSKEKLAGELRAQKKEKEREYLVAVEEGQVGPTGIRADYEAGAYE